MRRVLPPVSLQLSLGLLLLSGTPCMAASEGVLQGLLLDQAGQPLSDVLVSVAETGSVSSLPVLARSDAAGRVVVSDLDAGTYHLRIKSGQYRSPAGRFIEILPGHTAVVTLILQQLLDFADDDQQNLELKTLLRQSADGRLIFRADDLAGPETRRPPFKEAVFQIYTGSGMGSDYLVFPGDGWSGTSSQFAVADEMPAGGEYIVAGQISSGNDSLWRLRNFINHDLSDRHRVQFYLGLGRMSFAEAGLAVIDNPLGLAQNQPYGSSAATSQLLSAGFEDRIAVSRQVSLRWGLEYNRLKSGIGRTFWSPTVELTLEPLPATRVTLLASSRRDTRANSLVMPDGRFVSLSNSVTLARIGNELAFGTQRHYQAAFTHALRPDTEVEVALFDNRVEGEALPLVAVFGYDRPSELLRLNGRQAGTRGYRMTARRQVSRLISAEVSFIRGNVPTPVGEQAPTLGVLNDSLIGRGVTHVVATRVNAFVPQSSTHVTAIVNFITSGTPLATVDPLSDTYDVSNQGVNLFVRQVIPLPAGLLGFLGLDFLSPHQLEALVDVRNLLNDELASLYTPGGAEVSLMRNPRIVRGGIAVKF